MISRTRWHDACKNNLLDIDIKTASTRLDTVRDRMEQKPDSYHQKVRQGFLELASQQKNFATVDASADIETVHKNVLEVITQYVT